MSPDEIYLQNLRTIERIAGAIARQHSLNKDESGEFVQVVRVRLLDDNYGIIRKFQGKARFTTYLTTVIRRLYSEWRVQQWGKWRPSAEAKRLGDTALTLERLLSKDGLTYEEAVRVLTIRADARFTKESLKEAYLRLPPRVPRPTSVSDELLSELLVADATSNDRVEANERAQTARRARSVLDAAMKQFGPEDQLILQYRFWDSMTVAAIAEQLHHDQKKLYKRFEKLLRTLREELEKAGISQTDIAGIMMRDDEDPDPPSGMPGACPSHNKGGEESPK